MKILRSLTVFALVAPLAAPLMASGEYDGFHIGLRGGLAWSPDKNYGTLGTSSQNPTTALSRGMQLAPSVGVHAQWAFVPGRYSIGALVDYIKPVSRWESPDSAEAATIDQKIIRGELRFGKALRSNEDESPVVWLSPTFNRITTSSDHAGSLTENKMGGALGITGMRFRERCLTYWEAGMYFCPKTSNETKAGNLTLELRAGFLF